MTRITVDLSPEDYSGLWRWVNTAAAAVSPARPKLSLAQAVRAMIHATASDDVVADAVIDLLRREVHPVTGQPQVDLKSTGD